MKLKADVQADSQTGTVTKKAAEFDGKPTWFVKFDGWNGVNGETTRNSESVLQLVDVCCNY